ncbi:MAG: 6-carboxytetrahydropterin synthase [Methylorubrum extorquens]
MRQWLEQTFDHKTLVAADDPLVSDMRAMNQIGLVQLVVLPHVSSEVFAEYIFAWVSSWLAEQNFSSRIRLAEVHVREHGANAAKVLA